MDTRVGHFPCRYDDPGLGSLLHGYKSWQLSMQIWWPWSGVAAAWILELATFHANMMTLVWGRCCVDTRVGHFPCRYDDTGLGSLLHGYKNWPLSMQIWWPWSGEAAAWIQVLVTFHANMMTLVWVTNKIFNFGQIYSKFKKNSDVKKMNEVTSYKIYIFLYVCTLLVRIHPCELNPCLARTHM